MQMGKSKKLKTKSARKKANKSKQAYFRKRDETLRTTSEEEIANLEVSTQDLSKEKGEKCPKGKIIKRSGKKTDKKTKRKAETTSKKGSSGSRGSGSYSGSKEVPKENSGSEKHAKKGSDKCRKGSSMELTKDDVGSSELGTAERIAIGSLEGNKKKEHSTEEVFDKKKAKKRQPRPFFYTESDATPSSLQSSEEESIKLNRRNPRPYFYNPSRDAVPESLKELRKTISKAKRNPRPYFYDQKRDAISASLKEQKAAVKKTPRPYYRDVTEDSVPRSLKSEREKAAAAKRRTPRPFYYSRGEDISPSLKEICVTGKTEKRLRPLCYDESLDGITESLLSLKNSENSEMKADTARDIESPLAQSPPRTEEKAKNKHVEKSESSTESTTEDYEDVEVQKEQVEAPGKRSLFRDDLPSFIYRDTETANDTLSAQKLVKGDKVMDFVCEYITSKKGLTKILNLQHQFLLKQQRHISDFCHSEATEEGKNRSPNIVNFNEGAIRLLPTVASDSRYIHASQINLPYGNFIIAQGPTEQSLIDFFRMLWQCDVLLVVCLEPLNDRRTCYQYFSLKRQEEVKAGERISIGTRGILETTIPNLFVYEAVITNLEVQTGANSRRIYIVHYDKWTHQRSMSPAMLIKMITVMEAVGERKSTKPIVVHGSHGTRRTAIFVITSLLIKQIKKTHRMSVLNVPIAVRRRRYGVLRSLADYQLILQAALCYAKRCDLINNEKAFMDVMHALEEEDRDM